MRSSCLKYIYIIYGSLSSVNHILIILYLLPMWKKCVIIMFAKKACNYVCMNSIWKHSCFLALYLLLTVFPPSPCFVKQPSTIWNWLSESIYLVSIKKKKWFNAYKITWSNIMVRLPDTTKYYLSMELLYIVPSTDPVLTLYMSALFTAMIWLEFQFFLICHYHHCSRLCCLLFVYGALPLLSLSVFRACNQSVLSRMHIHSIPNISCHSPLDLYYYTFRSLLT